MSKENSVEARVQETAQRTTGANVTYVEADKSEAIMLHEAELINNYQYFEVIEGSELKITNGKSWDGHTLVSVNVETAKRPIRVRYQAVNRQLEIDEVPVSDWFVDPVTGEAVPTPEVGKTYKYNPKLQLKTQKVGENKVLKMRLSAK